MRRTKEWWARLTADERSRLVMMERADKQCNCGGWNLPDGYSECPWCSTPCSGWGLCPACSNELSALLTKANGEG